MGFPTCLDWRVWSALVLSHPRVRVARVVIRQKFTAVHVQPVKFKTVKPPSVELPNADLRPTILKKHITVRDQGAGGTCSVHAMTFLLEYLPFDYVLKYANDLVAYRE